ncbi:class IV adenylate cyclase [Candidatus Peregrinibacteria bacterium]|nr:class IV adenylate cyclase [Candidatus Peregrinibacteria bacterium]
MFEVEAKVAISKGDFCKLQKKLKNIAVFKGIYEKKDTYYNNSKGAFIRVRDENGDIIFGLKDKGLHGGIEANTEIEWGIKDAKKWNKILNNIDIKPFIRKNKKTEAYILDNFIIELNFVSKLGYFIEIERVVKSKKEILKAKKELIDMFKKLGYSHKDFEKKYYLDMLLNK